jgi:hypothetical protein
MSLRSKYASQVRRTFGSGYHAAWLPDTPHKLGSYGRMEDDVFVSFGNIRELGVPYSIDEDKIPSSLEVNASKGVAITAKGAGEINPRLPHLPQATAGMGIEFNSEGGFTISAKEVFEDRIKDPGSLETHLKKLRAKGKWDSSFRIVTGVLRMPTAAVLIAQADNTKLELSLSGTATPAINELSNLDVATSFHWQSSAVMKYGPARNATPIIQLHRLTLGFLFSPPRMRTFSMETIKAPGGDQDWRLVLDTTAPSE